MKLHWRSELVWIEWMDAYHNTWHRNNIFNLQIQSSEPCYCCWCWFTSGRKQICSFYMMVQRGQENMGSETCGHRVEKVWHTLFYRRKKDWILSLKWVEITYLVFHNRQSQDQLQVQRISLEDSIHSWLSHNIPGFPGPAGVILLSVPVLLCSTQIKFNDPLTSLYLSLCSLPPSSSLVPWGHRPITTPTSPACGTAVVTQHWPVPVSMATVPLRNPQHPQQPQGDSWTHTHRHIHSILEGCF